MNDSTIIFGETDSWTQQDETVNAHGYTPVYSEDDYPELFQNAEWKHVPLEEGTPYEDERRYTLTECADATQAGILIKCATLDA